jgi:hypothetical protein
MTDFSIKDKCERCGGTYDLDGVIYPHILQNDELYLQQATLCAVCREGFQKFMEERCNEKKSVN